MLNLKTQGANHGHQLIDLGRLTYLSGNARAARDLPMITVVH